MLPSFYSQYSPYVPQGLFAQFSGIPGAGLSPVSPALFGQPGAYGFNGSLTYPPSSVGVTQPLQPFSGLPNGIFASPYISSPYISSPYVSSPYVSSPFASFAGQAVPHPAQQMLLLLGQLAQQICLQGVASQQIGIGLYQLAYQLLAQPLAVQGIAPQPFIGTGQPFGLGAPFFAGTAPGGFGITPQQAQAWGATRPQTIQ